MNVSQSTNSPIILQKHAQRPNSGQSYCFNDSLIKYLFHDSVIRQNTPLRTLCKKLIKHLTHEVLHHHITAILAEAVTNIQVDDSLYSLPNKFLLNWSYLSESKHEVCFESEESEDGLKTICLTLKNEEERSFDVNILAFAKNFLVLNRLSNYLRKMNMNEFVLIQKRYHDEDILFLQCYDQKNFLHLLLIGKLLLENNNLDNKAKCALKELLKKI